MKINAKKVILMVLYSIAIALGSFASALSLLTHNDFFKFALLTITYILGIRLVQVRYKYPLIVNK